MILLAQKKESQQDLALVRFEQLYPLPQSQLTALKNKYKSAQFYWVQEEPKNMGAWGFILQHFSDWNFKLISRPEGASTATGSSKIHAKFQDELIQQALNV